MPAPNPIRSTGTLLHARPDGRSWDATAPNGWPLIAHLPGKSTPTFPRSEKAIASSSNSPPTTSPWPESPAQPKPQGSI